MNFDRLVGIADKCGFKVLAGPVYVGLEEFQAVVEHGVEYQESETGLPVYISTIQVQSADKKMIARGTEIRLESGKRYTTAEVVASDQYTVTRRMV
ncbi:hypothetical protein HBA55_34880 [Pseudomaricurvus alkylphenolicus]|uniref:hypothetical protein n=1 Tax=Pseudomaricurvus alkylphenolicus TaxID=1306991 RepID=UPI00142185CD|nr:hypothetical protein [Pseudomaricurvus alkylphenolicus]NIB44818.1 hypothetical protein [Pseudomaricurvus alkylphenolicus]